MHVIAKYFSVSQWSMNISIREKYRDVKFHAGLALICIRYLLRCVCAGLHI